MSARTLGHSEAVTARSHEKARELTQLTQALVLNRTGVRISAEAIEITWLETGRADHPWLCRTKYRVPQPVLSAGVHHPAGGLCYRPPRLGRVMLTTSSTPVTPVLNVPTRTDRRQEQSDRG